MRLARIALVALALVGCSGTAGAEEPSPEGRTFVSVGVTGDQIPGGGPLTLEFVDGRVSAFAGCNRGSGMADLAGGQLSTGDLATTMMACPPPFDAADAWMTRLLQSRPAWTLAGDDLTLSGAGLTVTLRDKEVLDPDRPLIDTNWRVDSLITRDAVMTSVVLEQAKPGLTIRADQTVVGWTGCNTFYGRAEVTGQTVAFGPVNTSGPACTGEVGELEQAVLRALTGEVSAIIESDVLTLTNTEGDGLRLRAE
ncbi:META domain-containing protein [Mycobacterium sp. NPDC003323]